MIRPKIQITVSVATVATIAKALGLEALERCCEAATRNRQKSFEIFYWSA